MSKRIDKKRRQYWLEKISSCEASGKSAFAWCKENNINNKAFYRWRSFFNQNKSSLNLRADSFIELNTKKCCRLEIEYKEYKFCLQDFSFNDLGYFFKALKGL